MVNGKSQRTKYEESMRTSLSNNTESSDVEEHWKDIKKRMEQQAENCKSRNKKEEIVQ